MLDAFVVERIAPTLASHWKADTHIEARVGAALVGARVGANAVEVVLRPESLARSAETGRILPDGVEIAFEVRLKHRQGALILEPAGSPAAAAPRVDKPLVRAVALANAWAGELASGRIGSVQEIARRDGLCHHYTARLMLLAFLAPDLTEAILQGRQPPALSLGALIREPLPLYRETQR